MQSTHEKNLIAAVRRVTRIQARLARLNRELKEAKGELKVAKKQLRALAQVAVGTQSPPLRGFDE
jgi:outer membrane protein TolC